MSNWIRACEKILAWDEETILPRHGPITDKSGVRALKACLEHVLAEARKRYDAGMSDEDAARDISWEAFRDWTDPERVRVNVHAAYREFRGDTTRPDTMRLFTSMARLHNERKAGAAPGHRH